MAHLQLRAPDLSATKQKAIEDAKLMQAAVKDRCLAANQEVPPYILSELIGKGSFGRVYKAASKKTSQLVAVKIIDIEESDTSNPKESDTYGEFLKEINALKLLSNSGAKNINHVIDALPVGQSMWMITEYCAGGSITTLMRPTAPGGLQERWIIPILREVAEAIFWVHKQGIIHRDIKCANILIHEAGGVQLCDFGVAGIIETKFDKRSTFIGTPHWMAPELFDQTKAYGTEVDIWAFGSMVYEIASGLPPNARLPDMTALGNRLKQHAPRLEGDQYSDGLKDLVAYCLEESPMNRPTIEQVQHHPYIFNSSAAYPTSSLAMLVRAFKLWEAQGGNRRSLFAPGGAQAPQAPDIPSTALASDEWNFSTTAAFDQQVFKENDTSAVYEAYGSQVDFNAEEQTDTEQTSRPPKGRGRRKPPNFPVLKAPLEKVFDPNTLTGYAENSMNYYGGFGPPPPPPPPPAPQTSDLPLRNGSGQGSDVRESLIDLDASLHGGDLSSFVDMETIRAGASHASVDYSMPEVQDFSKPPLSDPEQFNNNRRTQDWKFPTMAPPVSANPEMSRFAFNEEHSSPNSAGESSAHHFTSDSISVSQSFNSDQLTVPRAASQAANRASAGSLIDLDMSFADPVADTTRPSTAHSDVGSMTGSEFGGQNNPFELERHASLYVPFSSREPSIYVSDDSNFASGFSELANGNHQQLGRKPSHRGYHSEGQAFSSNEYSDGDYLMPQPGGYQQPHQHHQAYSLHAAQSHYQQQQQMQQRAQMQTQTQTQKRSAPRIPAPYGLPPAPTAPSEAVMLGLTSVDEVKDEFRRLMGYAA